MKSEIYEPKKISMGVYDLLARATMVAPHNREESLFDALNDVYKALSHTDNDYIGALSRLESKGQISNDEKLMLFVLHVTARDLGPYDLKKIRDYITEDDMPVVALEEIDGFVMSPKIKLFIKDILVRLSI